MQKKIKKCSSSNPVDDRRLMTGRIPSTVTVKSIQELSFRLQIQMQWRFHAATVCPFDNICFKIKIYFKNILLDLSEHMAWIFSNT